MRPRRQMRREANIVVVVELARNYPTQTDRLRGGVCLSKIAMKGRLLIPEEISDSQAMHEI